MGLLVRNIPTCGGRCEKIAAGRGVALRKWPRGDYERTSGTSRYPC